ncbi:MAG TPA: Holliday junction branch migration protein RuvA [Anaerolineae bacterium]|nr:Holliday junction branch migration protein RuvA [Anaerolineae bacterium]
MIASIKGKVEYKDDSEIVVHVGGIGIRVFIPQPTCAVISVGDFVTLHTYLVTRETGLFLYGFETIAQRDFFIHLISVSGIGPRIALAILSTLSVESIKRAVLKEQVEIFTQVPGIGVKTARKLVLFLKDRLEPLLASMKIMEMPDINSEVMAALLGLGYSTVEAKSALQSVPRDAPEDLETRLRLALQYFTT